MVKVPLQIPGNTSIFPVLALFFHLSLPKSWHAHPHKIFSNLTRIDLLHHKVWSPEIENGSLSKHLELGDF